MDEAARAVPAIRAKLDTSKRNLQEHDRLNGKVFKTKGKGIQTSLKAADNRIVNTHIKASTFVRRLEGIEHASKTVNLHPQISWMYSEIVVIDENLVSAYQHADSAVVFSDEQTYKLMDIREEVEVESQKLREHTATVERLLAAAKQSIKEDTAKIAAVNRSISSNESSIRQHQTSIDEKQQKINQLERDVSTAESQRYKANENRKDARNAAVATGVVTGISIVLLPFTFGLSGLVGGAAAAGMGIAIDKAIDYKKEVKRLQDSIWSLNSEKSTLTSAISSLTLQNKSLGRDVDRYREEIKEKQAEVTKFEGQIRDGSKTRKEMNSVESHASSTLSTVKDVLPELRTVRNNLEKFSDLVKERTVEVEESKDLTYKLMQYVPVVGARIKRKRHFEAQVSVLKQVVETLDHLHKDIPSLLPANVTKALDIKPWNSAQVSVREIGEDIPDLVMF